MRFWDSSAIVPLLVEEPATKAMRALLADDPTMLAWSLTSLEVTSALWRRARAGQIDDDVRMAAAVGLSQLELAWSSVTDIAQVVARARRLLAVHPLRAADAAQLGAALCACRERTDVLDFVTLDERLADAARREGLRVQSAVR